MMLDSQGGKAIHGGGGFLHRKFIEAKNREEALKKLRSMVDRVVEIKCCVRAVTW